MRDPHAVLRPGYGGFRPPGAQRAIIPTLYAGGIVRKILVQVALILLLIQAIFLAEKLNKVLGAAISLKASISDVVRLLTYTAPEVFDLALPMALLIAVYRVALQCREDRELLVLAGMGVGAHQFILLALGVGVAAQLVSLFISGTVQPRAQFAQRAIFFSAQFAALRGGITLGRFYHLGENTLFAGAQKEETRERRLFIHRIEGDTERVIIAARARLDGPDASGWVRLELNDVAAHDFRPPDDADRRPAGAHVGESCEDCPFQRAPAASIQITRYTQELGLSELLRFEPRGRAPAEWTSLELLSLVRSPTGIEEAHLAEMGRRFARSLLCLLAPLLAGVALVATTRATQAFALPAACAVLMCCDLAASAAAQALASAGLAAVLATLLGVGAALIAVLLKQTIVWQNAIIKPALARA